MLTATERGREPAEHAVRGHARALRRILGVYRAWSATRPPRCRYLPSCSEYADEALSHHGAFRGTWLTIRRLARCRPGGGFGFDPVPPRPGAREEHSGVE